MKKRILSVLITVLMLIGMLPTAIFAAETTEAKWAFGTAETAPDDSAYTSSGTLTEAFAAANGNEDITNTVTYVKLNKNVSMTHTSSDTALTLNEGKAMVLDLNSKTYSSSTTSTSGGDATYGIKTELNSLLTVKNGTISVSSSNDGFAIGIQSEGNLNVLNCTIEASEENANSGAYGIYYTEGVATITNCTITATSVDGRARSIDIGTTIPDLTIADCTVNAIGGDEAYAFYAHDYWGKMEFDVAGTITATCANGAFYSKPTTNEVTVTAGEAEGTATDADASVAATYANKYVKIEPVKYDLYIGGVQVTSANLVIDSTDSAAISGSATYNPELNTLTLNNFQYSGPGYKNEEYEYLYGALRVEGDNDLRIVFTGQNVIECTNGDERWGLYTDFNGDLHIKAETIDSCLTFIGDVACGRVPVFDGNFVIYAGDNEADAKITAEDTFASQYYTYSYVRYEPTLMVTFDYGTLGSETKTVLNGETVTPPAPVFAGKVLVGWYTDSSFATEFNFSDAINANKTIYAKFADYEGDKAALQDAIDALETAVGNVETALNNKVSTDKLTEEVGKLNQAIADAKTYADTQDAALKTTLEAADATMNAAITELQNRVTALETGLTTANGKIDTNTTDINTLKTNVSTLETWKTEAQNAITALQGLTNTQGTSISALQAAVADLQTAVSTVNSNIAAAEARIAVLESKVTDLETATANLQNAVTALQAAVAGKADTATVNAAIAELQTAINALEAVKNNYIGADDALRTELEGKIANAKSEAIASAETLVNNAKAELQSKIDAKADAATTTVAIQNLQAAVAALEAVKDDYATADATLKAELEGKIATAKSEAIASAETLVNNAKAELQSKIDAKADAATTTVAIQNLQAAVAALEAVKDDYATADATLKTELEGKIETAKSEAITAANTALTTAKNELSQAIALKADTATLNDKVDALNTAIANAESVAKAYADTQDAALKGELQTAIANAKSEAIGAAQLLVDNAKAELQTAIDTKADTATVNAAIANLQNAITALEAAKDNYASADAALKLELEAAIERAKQEAIEASKDYIPYIGTNGNWWIGDTDTGVKAAGDDGKDGAIIAATAVGGTALISNIALIAWALIKKKRLF